MPWFCALAPCFGCDFMLLCCVCAVVLCFDSFFWFRTLVLCFGSVLLFCAVVTCFGFARLLPAAFQSFGSELWLCAVVLCVFVACWFSVLWFRVSPSSCDSKLGLEAMALYCVAVLWLYSMLSFCSLVL